MAQEDRVKFRVLITGGGSGGHIYPLIATVRTLREYTAPRGIVVDARYFGQPGSFALDLEREQIPVYRIATSKLRRYFSLLNVLDFFKFFFGFLQALFKIFWFMPDVAFSKGGPGALSILAACRFYRIPIIVHESDAVAGFTNIRSGRWARIIDLAYEDAGKYFSSKAELHVVGSPVRADVVHTEESPMTSRMEFDLPNKKPVLLIVGGSQGAQAINYFVLENSELLLSHFEIIHSTGRDNFLEYKAEFEFMTKNFSTELKRNYVMVPYLDNRKMAAAFNACDMIVSRAGASAIAEIAAVGKPAVLIPLPTSANNHQRANAYAYEKRGAAIVIEEENLLPNLFVRQVERVIQNPQELERMSQSARTFYRVDAAELIAKDILTASHLTAYLSTITQEV